MNKRYLATTKAARPGQHRGHFKANRRFSGAVLAGLMTSAAVSVSVTGVASGEPVGVCSRIAHVGDSLSVGLNDPAVISEEADRLTARYKAAGATSVVVDALGGRAIVERVGGGTNAIDALTTLNTGDPACYVVAMGTNDAANITVGSRIDPDERIERVMGMARGRPVLWPTLKTLPLATVRGYTPDSMTKFNAALKAKEAEHPNLLVVDWAATVNDRMFQADGIHLTSAGNRSFAAWLADRLGEMSKAARPPV